MIEVRVSLDMLAAAKAPPHGDLSGSYRTTSKANLIGYLAEEIFKNQFPLATKTQSYESDFELNGKTIDIKSCMTRYSAAPHHLNHVYTDKGQLERNVDIYVFVSIYHDFLVGWILGFISKADFIKQATFYAAGSPVKNNTKLKNKVDSYAIETRRLSGIAVLL